MLWRWAIVICTMDNNRIKTTTGIKDERNKNWKRWSTREAPNKNAIITYSFMIFYNLLNLQAVSACHKTVRALFHYVHLYCRLRKRRKETMNSFFPAVSMDCARYFSRNASIMMRNPYHNTPYNSINSQMLNSKENANKCFTNWIIKTFILYVQLYWFMNCSNCMNCKSIAVVNSSIINDNEWSVQLEANSGKKKK